MDTNSRLNKKAPLRTFYDVITIITNITFIVSSIMGFKVALVDNCFEIGQKNSSFMDEFLTKTQKLVLFPALLFLLDFAFAAWDSISLLIEKCSCGRNRSEASVENNEEILSQQDRKNRKKEGKKTRPKVRRVGCLIRDILKAAVSTMSLLASIFAFTLYKDGVCVHQLFSGQCPPMRFRIEALSHFHLSITSTVMFPSSLGTQTHTETFKVTVNSFLLPTSSNKDHIKCNDGQGKRIEDKHGEITCAYDAFEDKFPEIYETHNSQQLGTANGILLQWPCNVISQFRHVRKSVECFFRIQIQVNEDSDFTYNSDVVYKLNESVPESIATLQKWNKISKYGSFSSIFNTDSEQSYRALRSLLSTLDDTYESLPLDTPSMDLMASEPHFLHFNCNRSCACYECVADLNVKKGPKCQLICPNVDSSKYSDHSKNLFCQPDNPDRCEKEWIPISTKLNSDKESVVLSDRVNYQEAPKVTVVLPSGRVEAKLDEKLQLPNPSTSC